MAKKPDKNKLVNAAKELNDLIKPDPPISTEGEVKDMLKQVTSAAALLEPGDCISKDTGAFLSEQGIDHKASVGGGEGKVQDKDEPPDTSSAVVKKDKKASGKKTPAGKKSMITKGDKPGKTDAYGFRIDSIMHQVALIIEAGKKKGVSVQDIKDAKWNTRKDSYKSYWMKMVERGHATYKDGRIFLK